MGSILEQVDGAEPAKRVRCRVCGRDNQPMQYCRHVRWTFDQGDPIDFTRFALETSPYTHGRGFATKDIPAIWWAENGEWIVEEVMLHFDVSDGYVFGELADLDNLARDIWKAFRPEPLTREPVRY